MTDTNYDAFRNNLIARDLIFPDAGLSEMSRRMNEDINTFWPWLGWRPVLQRK